MKNNYILHEKARSFNRLFSLFLFLTFSSLCTNTLALPKYKIDLQHLVSGKVTDSHGTPLPGVQIQIEGTQQGTITSINGTFSITSHPYAELIISSLGFITQQVSINNRDHITIILEEDITQLNEITINAGYYSVKEREQTGNIIQINKDAIEEQDLPNPLAAIQGRAAGVEIIQTSGIPGAAFDIKIRGQNSIRSNGNDPLFVVDGVPFPTSTLGNAQTSSLIIPGLGVSPLNNLNSNDIETIEILKDADATAIYGSRGANGVVLITTKKGKSGKTSFIVNLSSGLGEVANPVDVLNTSEYISMRQEAYTNDGVTQIPFNAYDINGTWDPTKYTNWQKELFGNTSFLTNAEAQFSGGSEYTQFLVSGNYNKQTTVFSGDFENEKVSILSSLHHKTKNDKLNLQFSVNYTTDTNNLPATSIVREALLLSPNAPNLYNTDGSLNWENSTWNNPLRNFEGSYLAKSTNLISNAVLKYTLLNGLDFNTSFGFTQSQLNEIKTTPNTILNPAFGIGSEASSAFHNNANRTSWIIEPQLNWKTQFKNSTLEALFGMTFQDEITNTTSIFANGFTSNAFIENLAAAQNVSINENSEKEYKYQAFFARLNINHKGKYFVNLTGRRDGSSRFGSENKFANFGAVGAAWIFSREGFSKSHLNFLSFGKIRASYGSTGNDQIGDYQYFDTFAFSNSVYQNTIGLRPSRLYNPNFSWEKNIKFEAGLELGFLNDRINFSSSYYQNTSSNQLVGIPLPRTTGFSSINANLNATVENTGWEFELQTINIQSDQFKWSTNFNITIPTNRLVSFPNLEGSTYSNQLVLGEPLNILKLYQSQGVNPDHGFFEFTDFDGNGIISRPQDNQIIKDLNPSYYGGISNTFTYGRFNLDILFNFTKQLGMDYVATTHIPGTMNNQSRDVLHRWQNAGDQTDVQKYTSGLNYNGTLAFSNYAQSDAAIIDASYLRLKTLSLTYTLTNVQNMGIGCKFFLRGQNLWTLTNYNGLDPETRSNTTIPPLRFITLGTTLTF